MDQKAISELSNTSLRANECEAPLYFHIRLNPGSHTGINFSISSSGSDGVFSFPRKSRRYSSLLAGPVGCKRGFKGLAKDRFALNSIPSSTYLIVVRCERKRLALVLSAAALLKLLALVFPVSISFVIALWRQFQP